MLCTGRCSLYKINHLVSGRVYIMNTYYKDQGLSLFPRTQEIFYTSYHGLIDNSYMQVTFYAGILVAVLFFVIILKTMLRLYRMECYLVHPKHINLFEKKL